MPAQKEIIFICGPHRVRWTDLTGIAHPTGNDKQLRAAAECAKSVDPRVTGYELVTGASVLPRRATR